MTAFVLAAVKRPRFVKCVVLTLSVFGNHDGELGRRMADGTLYTREVVAFACNCYPLGSVLRVTSPEGRTLVAVNRDRHAALLDALEKQPRRALDG